MRRLSVICLVVVATLAVEAAALYSVFSVRKMSEDGYALLYARQTKECDENGGCVVLSQGEFENIMHRILGQMKRSGVL
jgi:hypothetical protein